MMNLDPLTITNLLLTNGVIVWVALRVINRVDKLEERQDRHETRLSIAEKTMEYTQLAKK